MTDRFTINIKTDADEQGIITQRVDILGDIQRHVIDTRDAQVRESLIALGWTPPKPDTGNRTS